MNRLDQINKLKKEDFDFLVIGGGINGATSAASLNSQGIKTALVDMGDFASGTSQESSNLVWGGIKYLETYEFPLVWNLCKSRNQLLKLFPNNIKEIRFYTCVQNDFRKSKFLLYIGALLYWAMGRFYTKAPRPLSKKTLNKEQPNLNLDFFRGGVEYSDAYLVDNDSRLTFSFIKRIWRNNGVAANYLKIIDCTFKDNLWSIKIEDQLNKEVFTIKTKGLINAGGPHIDEINKHNKIETKHEILLSKGIHLIVKKLFPDNHIKTFFADDGRLFFAIPMGNQTCIGTTDTPVKNPNPEIQEEDIEFILKNINQRFQFDNDLTKKDIINYRCGVRPLVTEKKDGQNEENWMQLSRKHELEILPDKNYISIFGGKLTDCLNIGDEICEAVKSLNFPISKSKDFIGDPPLHKKLKYIEKAKAIGFASEISQDGIDSPHLRLWRRYAEDAYLLLDKIEVDKTQGEELIAGTGFLRCEAEYYKSHEMICKLEDLLRRRTKISLVKRSDDLINDDGLTELCKIIFGEEKYRIEKDKYFETKYN